MNRIKLNGADAEKVAELIDGTLIMENVTDGIATIAGGDISKLNQMQPAEKYGLKLYTIYYKNAEGEEDSDTLAHTEYPTTEEIEQYLEREYSLRNVENISVYRTVVTTLGGSTDLDINIDEVSNAATPELVEA